MARPSAIAVIDIGKSNGKLALVEAASGRPLAIRTVANTVIRTGPYPHYDVDRLWQWILAGLKIFGAEADIEAIATTTHGACFALMSGDDLALPVIDYEFTGLESVHQEYVRLRGDFSETLSPDLPNGLNAGRQLYWLQRTFPTEFARADAILPYPQYWVLRLTGRRVAEATSLGSHTDLWNPRTGGYSTLVESQNWRRLFPPIVKAWDTVGTILPEIAALTGLPPATRVVAGIHDSNASLLPHLLSRQKPFAVLSTGTWMIVLAPGGDLDKLDSTRDCLANVDAFGQPVPSARFMAGREYEIVAGGGTMPSDDEIKHVVDREIMVLPTFAPATGPFGGRRGQWSHDPAGLAPGERAAVASLYTALLTETCLGLTSADGTVIVEGPFAQNRLFISALAQRVGRPVIPEPDGIGTTQGAALLTRGVERQPRGGSDKPVMPLDIDLTRYADAWQKASSGGGISPKHKP